MIHLKNDRPSFLPGSAHQISKTLDLHQEINLQQDVSNIVKKIILIRIKDFENAGSNGELSEMSTRHYEHEIFEGDKPPPLPPKSPKLLARSNSFTKPPNISNNSRLCTNSPKQSTQMLPKFGETVEKISQSNKILSKPPLCRSNSLPSKNRTIRGMSKNTTTPNNIRDSSLSPAGKTKILNSREREYFAAKGGESARQSRESSISQPGSRNNSSRERDRSGSSARDSKGHKSRSQTPSKVTFDVAPKVSSVEDHKNDNGKAIKKTGMSFEWVDFKTNGKTRSHVKSFIKVYYCRRTSMWRYFTRIIDRECKHQSL